jgi:AraC-like DNA-binding protein
MHSQPLLPIHVKWLLINAKRPDSRETADHAAGRAVGNNYDCNVARERMLHDGMEGASAAFEVGYENALHFVREHSSFFAVAGA